MKNNDNQAMFKAIEKGDKRSLEEFFEENAEAIEEVGFHNRLVRDKTPLMFAMQCSNFELSHWLLDQGANASAVMPAGPKSSVLGLCSYFAYCDLLHHDQWIVLATRLLELGADPSTGLWQAICGYGKIVKRTDYIKLLFDRGASLDQKLACGDSIRDIVEINRSKYPEELIAIIDKN